MARSGDGTSRAGDDTLGVEHHATASRRRPGTGTIALLLALAAATGLSALAVVRARDVAPLRAEVESRRTSVTLLERRNESLAARVERTERGLARRQAGVAPLAKRILRSVFTIETATSLGSGFAGWGEDGAVFVVTANHVVADADGPHVRVSRKTGSWSGEIVGRDARRDLAVIRLSGRPAGVAPLW